MSHIPDIARLECAEAAKHAAALRREAIFELHHWLHAMAQIANAPNPEEYAMDLTAACLEVSPDEILSALGGQE